MDLFASDRPGLPTGAPPAAEPGSTPPPARAPHAGGLGLDDWSAGPDRTPRRWLLLAAVAPWLVVAVLLVRDPGAAPATTPPPEVSSPAPTPLPSAPASPGATPTAGRPDPATDDPAVTTSVTADTVDDRGRAVGLAVTVARAWLSTRPSALVVDGVEPAPGAATRYVEHLVVEAVDHPARGALVVTLRAVVLPIEEDRYGDPDAVRLAVPVRLTSTGPQLGGPPWWLATEDVAPAPPTVEPVDDPDLRLAAAEAVDAAGYAEVQLEGLERTDGWAWVAHVTARAPGQEEAGDHAIWLRADVGRLVVAGTSPPRDDGAGPAPTATDGPGPADPTPPPAEESP